MNALQKLLDFLSELDERRISFELSRSRALDLPTDMAIMVKVNVPGERWEVEFFADGHVEVEVFRSIAGVMGEEELTRLFERFSD